ncbi:SDR family NAD(P)-dependent oxidoreductase, partial [Rhizobiaceae sp. 2RAB30]
SKRPGTGKVALVTGSSRGIGLATARRLANDGYTLALAAIGETELHQAVAEIDRISSAFAVEIDLSDADAIPPLVDRVVSHAGRIDVLVNNAGATRRGSLQELSQADWMDGFSVKLFGTVALTRAAWPHLVETRGSVINIAGALAHSPNENSLIGGAICSALLNFTKAVAETGRRQGVRVNAINPGWIDTGRLASQLEAKATRDGHGDLTKAADDMIAELQLIRFGRPEDIAELIAFLLSERGSFFHGALLDMDGGMTKGL